MRSPITQFGFTASVLLVAALVVFNVDQSGTSNGIVWAQVLQKTEQITTITHREKRIFWRIGQDEPCLEADVIKYASNEFGVLEEQYDPNGNVMHRFYILKDPPRAIMILPPCKKYLEVDMDDDLPELFDLITPKGLVAYFTQGECTDLGRTTFDGHDVEGFEAYDPNAFAMPIPPRYRFLFPVRDLTYRIYVDVDTSLPVGGEFMFSLGRCLFTGFQEVEGHISSYDLQWDVDIDPAVFEPNIPADYTPIPIPSPPTAQQAALLGLGALPLVLLIRHRRHANKYPRTLK